MTAQKDNPKLTITLTDRRPVKINKEAWPIYADATDSWHDNQYECQANRKESVVIRVRKHADGRSIVYGVYDYSTQWQDERDACARVGVMIDADADLVEAIKSVGAMLEARDITPQNVSIKNTVAACVADLPAEEI